ncbi:hypothetical protein RHMOL_Rhmol01G0254300 [Rhododendron molle]|uniref:Uncharacterized protein n=1 Tax=Rhododendron molle TaxID=49168 RepID=A0ACC0Q552_RHOML|nr:hypothetical protein RHMOL_Rhmol01G0254300 [Rhododendron molle]
MSSNSAQVAHSPPVRPLRSNRRRRPLRRPRGHLSPPSPPQQPPLLRPRLRSHLPLLLPPPRSLRRHGPL